MDIRWEIFPDYPHVPRLIVSDRIYKRFACLSRIPYYNKALLEFHFCFFLFTNKHKVKVIYVDKNLLCFLFGDNQREAGTWTPQSVASLSTIEILKCVYCFVVNIQISCAPAPSNQGWVITLANTVIFVHRSFNPQGALTLLLRLSL